MIDKFDVTIPALTGNKPRKAYVYLPEDYNPISPRRYSVLYMFDGHNVFFDEDATYGKSWGMGDYLEAVEADVIVAAVECNHEGHKRLSEYSPVPITFRDTGPVEPQGKETMDWFVEEFKPYIDTHYKTIPFHGRTDGPVCRHRVQRCILHGCGPFPQFVAGRSKRRAVY